MKKNKNKKKGFTLIELLAVIVILGLLIAIAIPSVSKYITESRKKTLTSTISNYVGAVLNEVNNMEYTFTGYNTVYAVPIDCIALERGGTNPFGEWLNPNGKYFAYVLVQYDDNNESYTYGFTFKDSAGYGMYPIAQNKLNTNGNQIKTNLLINQPQTGKVTNIASLDKWEGFKVNADTNLVVLEAKEKGDNKTTCTRVQESDKVVNDDVIQDTEQEENNSGSSVEKLCTLTEGTALAVGSKYTCNLGDGDRTFYVLENIADSENVSLILDRNITSSDVNWCSDGSWDNTCGGTGAAAALADNKPNWNNASIVSITLPTGQQIANASGHSEWTSGDDSGFTVPDWLGINTAGINPDGTNGYWTNTPYTGNSLTPADTPYIAWQVAWGGYFSTGGASFNFPFGIRPVVTLPKNVL